MKIIEPSIEVLDNLDGQAILKKIERIGRVCYKSENNITDDSAERFIQNIIKSGHESVLEHVSISVRVICDRGVSHEIVRHRVASYSQESTRYNNYSKDKYGSELTFIKPVWIDVPLEILNMINPKFLMKALDMGGKLNGIAEDEFMWISTMDAIECMYFSLLKKGWTPEQARSILPNSLKTEIVMTMNLREWRQFLKLRTSNRAHPQTREIANMILEAFKSKIPVVFDDIEESEKMSAEELEPHEYMKNFNEACNKFAISIVDHAYGEEKGNEHMIEQFCCILRAGLKWLKCENVPLKEVKNNILTVFDDI